MELADTHCHIQSAGLKRGERVTRELWTKAPELSGSAMVEAAVDAGVTRLICVGCDLEDSRLAIEFVSERGHCWASIGIHPHEAKRYSGDAGSAERERFAALAGKPKVVAIGEAGLDYYYGHSPKTDQAAVLRFQMELAIRTGLPMIFHVREAFDDFWPVFDAYDGIRGVLHSFTDTKANLEKALERGLYIGVNGIATFTKEAAQLEAYKALPSSRLLLETDAPFLTPKPFRGSVNQPKRVAEVADFLAGLRGESKTALAEATTANTRDLFKI